VISEVPIGLWNESLVALENSLRENGIALYQLRSDWDAQLHPHASAGFFRFKKAIPEAVRSVVTPS
jgi:deoxyribodipyrimidine photo-lyase